MHKRLFTVFLACSSVALQAEPYTLKFSTYSAEANPVANCVEKPIIAEIEAKSNGRIKVESHFAGSPLSTPSRQYDQIAKGITDVSITFSTFSPGPMAALNITATPFAIINDDKAVSAVYSMRESIEETWNHNVKLGTVMFAGNAIYGIREKTTINSFTELRNYKFLTSIAGIPTAKALDLNAKNVPLQTWYESLSKGVYDGWGGVASQVLSFKLIEVSNAYYYIPNLFRPAGAILISRKFYKSLPEDLQTIIDEATGPKVGQRLTQCYLKVDAMAKAMAEKQGQTWTVASEKDIKEMTILTSDETKPWLQFLMKTFNIPAMKLHAEFMKLQKS